MQDLRQAAELKKLEGSTGFQLPGADAGDLTD